MIFLSLKCLGEAYNAVHAVGIHSSPMNQISCGVALDPHQVKEREERKAAARQAEEADRR